MSGESPPARNARAACDRDELLQWTTARLGRQQRIADVLWRDALPRTANGKILKRELRAELGATEY